MSQYTRTTYIILGSNGYSQWEDFATGIFTQVLVNQGAGFVIDRQTVKQENLTGFMDLSTPKLLALINVTIEDVLNGTDFSFVHDFIWATCEFGDPGKIVILGHGSLTAAIGAYTTLQQDVYQESPQREFIGSIFPDWPPPLPQQVAQAPNNGLRGLEVIALKQCYGARTATAYVTRTYGNQSISYEAAAGSAVAITADELRAKGWNGTGVTVTASPEYNVFTTSTGVVKMATVMPKVEGGGQPTQKAASTVKLPKSHKVKREGGRSFIETDIRLSGAVFVRDTDGSWWKPETSSTVFYPDDWIRTRGFLTWKIWLPEYVVPDPLNNKIDSISAEQSMHLKKTDLKIRVVL